MNDTKILHDSIREVRAVFGPPIDASGNKVPVRAVAVAVHDDTELTVEVTGMTDLGPIGGLDVTREVIDASSFDRPQFAEYVAGRLSGLLTLGVSITGPDGVRMTRRERGEAVPIEHVLPGVPTGEAVATLLQDRDFVHRRVQLVEAELGRRMAMAEQADQRHEAERAAWAAELRDALTVRDRWRKLAKRRKRTLVEARRLLADVGALPPYPHKIKGGDES